MTQTVSFKEKFNSGFAVFKSEIKSCAGTLIVFSILASVFITIVFTLALVAGYSETLNDGSFDYEQVISAISVFQVVASYVVFALNAVFTIVYTIRIYSYLHNKRKADLYGSMPISRRTFFISKTVSAFILSVIPTMFFFSVITIISVCFGNPVIPEVASLYYRLPIGALACISFYGLLAVCCGTTLNSVLSFIAINFAYPVATLFIKGTIKAFFIGMPTNQYNASFIMKALNPLSAYIGSNIIYWIIFTAACLFLGILLVKKRRAECAQTSFAYYLPCHIVKLLVSFIIGIFFGVLFGSLNVLGYGFFGFIFGFALGSIPAYIITHLILHKGFTRLIKSAIPFGAMFVTVIILVGFCNYDPLGYSRYLPSEENIKSAGLIDLGDCCFTKTKSDFELARMASDDYEDDTNIKTINKFHRSVLEEIDVESSEKFGSVWTNLLLSNISSEYFDNGYCVAYRLNNGRLVYRYYDEYSTGGLFGSNYIDFDNTSADKITGSDTYFINYSTIMNADEKLINDMRIVMEDTVYEGEDKDTGEELYIDITSNDNVDSQKAKEDRKKLLEAYRKDFEEVGSEDDDAETICDIAIKFDIPESSKDQSLLNQLVSVIDGDYSYPEHAVVYSDYKNTIAALKEIGVLKADNSLNTKTCPYEIEEGYIYDYYWR